MKRRNIFDVSRNQRYKSKVINGNPDELGTVLFETFSNVRGLFGKYVDKAHA